MLWERRRSAGIATGGCLKCGEGGVALGVHASRRESANVALLLAGCSQNVRLLVAAAPVRLLAFRKASPGSSLSGSCTGSFSSKKVHWDDHIGERSVLCMFYQAPHVAFTAFASA
jgi:hypothetical protein